MLIKLLLEIALSTVAIYTAAELTPGISIESIQTALVAFLVLALVNSIIKPILKLITLPINIITLGIFGLFLNFALLAAVFHIVPGLTAERISSIILFSIILTIINWIVSVILE